MAHGYVRTTDDLDLITERGRRASSGKMFADLGMSIKKEAANFSQFESQDESIMDVDLMLVSEAVFGQMKNAAVEKKVDGIPVRVVSLLHLIALKCHALQNSESKLRGLKDTDDLIHLILFNGLDLKDPELRAIILKHGSEELYEKLRHACAE